MIHSTQGTIENKLKIFKMPRFSLRSIENLATCSADIQLVLEIAIKQTDFTVLCGHRNQEDQQAALEKGASQVGWPNSRHNSLPSEAVDIAPWPIEWTNYERFYYLAGVILTIARMIGVELEWGGHWTNFKDFVHFQLARKEGELRRKAGEWKEA